MSWLINPDWTKKFMGEYSKSFPDLEDYVDLLKDFKNTTYAYYASRGKFVNNEYHLEVDIPGVKKEDVQVEVVGELLKVTTPKGLSSFRFKSLDLAKMTAKVENGQLLCVIPTRTNTDGGIKIEVK